MSTLSEDCSCLAFYSDVKQEIDYQSIHSLFISVGKAYGCDITHAAVSGKGYPTGLKTINYIEKRLKAKLYQDIDSFTVYSVVSEMNTYYDWQFYASVTSSREVQNYELIFCLDRKYDLFNIQTLSNNIINFNKLFIINYGIGYIRPYILGPQYYASGVIQGLERNSIESEKIALWFRAILNNRFFKMKILRDVYPINILNNQQLQIKINIKSMLSLFGGMTLEQWIVKYNFGILIRINEQLCLWHIDDNLIKSVAQKLCERELLLHCLPEH